MVREPRKGIHGVVDEMMNFTGPNYFQFRTTEVLLELVKLRQLITMMRTELMATLQELKDAVAANTAVDQSAIVLLNGLTAKIQELLDAGTELATLKAGLQEVVDEVNADTQAIADAVIANTPAETPPA